MYPPELIFYNKCIDKNEKLNDKLLLIENNNQQNIQLCANFLEYTIFT